MNATRVTVDCMLWGAFTHDYTACIDTIFCVQGRVYGQVDEAELRRLLAAIDADGKGSLTYEECKALVNKFKVRVCV